MLLQLKIMTCPLVDSIFSSLQPYFTEVAIWWPMFDVEAWLRGVDSYVYHAVLLSLIC